MKKGLNYQRIKLSKDKIIKGLNCYQRIKLLSMYLDYMGVTWNLKMFKNLLGILIILHFKDRTFHR